MKELDILEYEINSIKDDKRHIYKQQTNSNIFFLTSKNEILADIKRKKEKINKLNITTTAISQ